MMKIFPFVSHEQAILQIKYSNYIFLNVSPKTEVGSFLSMGIKIFFKKAQ